MGKECKKKGKERKGMDIDTPEESSTKQNGGGGEDKDTQEPPAKKSRHKMHRKPKRKLTPTKYVYIQIFLIN